MARFFQPKKRSALDTKHQAVSIEKLDHLGAGIAYLNKKPVFIEGALSGEEVLIQLTESKSKFARGKLIKILKPSSQRIDAFCPHYAQCGGCDLQHLSLEAQTQHKQQALSQLMSKFASQQLGLSPPVIGSDKGYRRRARISVMWDKKARELKFGFRRKQSKDIVTVTDCAVLESSLNKLLPELRDLLAQFKKPEQLGHVELVKGDNTSVLVLRHLSPLADKDLTALEKFAEHHQLTLYVMPAANELNKLIGEQAYYQEVGVTIPFLPSNFIQVNQQVNEKMVAQAIEWLDVKNGDRVLDLFCGLGNFSLPLAKLSKQVVGIEGVQEMVDIAKANAQLNNIDNAEFYQANLEEELANQNWAKEKFNRVLLDPARAGAAGIVEQLANFGAERIVYVSCNPATLARDSQSLLEQGYQLQKLGMLDMFPHTSHLESMALFVKQ